MTEAELYRRACAGKIAHATQELAESALREVKRNHRGNRKSRLNTYHCRFGDHWHVGHERRMRKPARGY